MTNMGRSIVFSYHHPKKGKVYFAWKWLFAALLIISISACGNANESDKVDLIVALSATPEHIMIDNGNSYVWNNAKITINNRYIYESEMIPRGGTSLNLTKFTKQDGTSFNPKKDRLYSVSIYVPEALDGKHGVFNW
jgi:hypothetical protein